ncbi:MAG: hypothetical protein ACM3QX_02275 [Syntrophomonadaceae bacterium]
MKRNKLTFILFAVVFLLVSLGIDLRNAVENGDIFRMNGDFLDQMHFYLQIPGSVPTFPLIWLFFKSMHSYNIYFAWSLSLLFNCLFYGYAGYWLYPWVKTLIASKQKKTGTTSETQA